tara:strand:+ start:1407 stop:1922 length:516 start_codon:yes stop_codon:yes gene_type:complete
MFSEQILLSKEECNSILQLQGEFTESMVYSKTSKVKLSSRISEESYVTDLDKLKEILLPKLNKLGVKGLPDDCKILKYKEGSFFREHSDANDKEYAYRKQTLIIQLSEENDYSGARLVVGGKGCSKEIGNVILFDSARKHKVTKLIRGLRYVLVCWLHKEHLKLDGYKTIL